MDTGSLTEKSREALQEAQNLATRMGHTEVDGEHLLLALVDQQDGLVPRLLEQAGANVDALRSDLERELSRRPKVSGPGATPAAIRSRPFTANWFTRQQTLSASSCRASAACAAKSAAFSGQIAPQSASICSTVCRSYRPKRRLV